MTPIDPTQRFSNRVENYLKFRPRYPEAVLGILRDACGLVPAHVVADVGSGTGFLTALFLKNGNRVYGVEPNREMREAGERFLKAYGGFASVDGRAEATTLPSAGVDLITAGQAFHWFDRPATRIEFNRILKPDGWIALVWNERDTHEAFGRAYERLLREHDPEQKRVDHREIDRGVMDEFFGAGHWRLRACPHRQTFDFESLCGRLLSSSHAPEPGEPGYAPMIAALHSLFDRFQRDGQVAFEYTTKVYVGRLTLHCQEPRRRDRNLNGLLPDAQRNKGERNP